MAKTYAASYQAMLTDEQRAKLAPLFPEPVRSAPGGRCAGRSMACSGLPSPVLLITLKQG